MKKNTVNVPVFFYSTKKKGEMDMSWFNAKTAAYCNIVLITSLLFLDVDNGKINPFYTLGILIGTLAEYIFPRKKIQKSAIPHLKRILWGSLITSLSNEKYADVMQGMLMGKAVTISGVLLMNQINNGTNLRDLRFSSLVALPIIFLKYDYTVNVYIAITLALMYSETYGAVLLIPLLSFLVKNYDLIDFQKLHNRTVPGEILLLILSTLNFESLGFNWTSNGLSLDILFGFFEVAGTKWINQKWKLLGLTLIRATFLNSFTPIIEDIFNVLKTKAISSQYRVWALSLFSMCFGPLVTIKHPQLANDIDFWHWSMSLGVLVGLIETARSVGSKSKNKKPVKN